MEFRRGADLHFMGAKPFDAQYRKLYQKQSMVMFVE